MADVVWPEAIGRILEDGPERKHPYGCVCLRSYGEYSKEHVINSGGMSTEGEEVFTRSQVENLVEQAEEAGQAAFNAVINFVIFGEGDLEYLRLWNEGEFESCREEWPEAPDECYIGADTLFKPK